MAYGGFDIVWFMNAEGLDTSCVNSQIRASMMDALSSSMEGIGKVLAFTCYVAWLTTPLLQPHRFLQYLGGQLGCEKRRGNLYLCTSTIPVNLSLAEKSTTLMSLCQRYLRNKLGHTLTRLGFDANTPRAVIVNHPYHLYYRGVLDERILAYECYDDFTLRDGEQHVSHLTALEAQLARRSDLVFATSRVLTERLQKENSRTHYLPNGVDFDLFHQATRPDVPIAAELTNIRRPIVGFMGHLNDWFDMDLLTKVVRSRPDWSFVFTGQIADDVRPLAERLLRLPNVLFLGWLDYERLPQYMKAFETVIMPYRLNERTRTLNPMKIYQFMAAGIPIVSTSIPEAVRLSGIIEIADGAEAFAAAVERCIAQRDTVSIEEGITLARRQSWQSRADKMISLISEWIEAK